MLNSQQSKYKRTIEKKNSINRKDKKQMSEPRQVY